MLENINKLTINNAAEYMPMLDACFRDVIESYLVEKCGGDITELRERAPAFLLYLSDCIGTIDLNNVLAINYLFTVYCHICADTLDRLPTLGMFCIMINVSADTLEYWAKGKARTREHADFAQKAKAYCKALVIDKLSNKSQADVNLIFISKAAYGMRETAPITDAIPEQKQAIDSIAYELGIDVNDDSSNE